MKLDLTDDERSGSSVTRSTRRSSRSRPRAEVLRELAEKLERAEGLPAGRLAKLPSDGGLLGVDEFHRVCGEIGGDNLPGLLRFGLKLFREDDHEGSGYKIIVHGDILSIGKGQYLRRLTTDRNHQTRRRRTRCINVM